MLDLKYVVTHLEEVRARLEAARLAVSTSSRWPSSPRSGAS